MTPARNAQAAPSSGVGAQLVFAGLNLVLTAPSVYLWLGLPLLMREQGWSAWALGLFQLASLPAVLKFVMGTVIDRYPGSADRTAGYRRWATGLVCAYAAVLLALGWRVGLDRPLGLFALAGLAAVLATWADIPVNALAIRRLPAQQQPLAGGLRSLALSVGAIVGGGLMLLVQARWGWAAPFLLMALALLVGLCGLWLLPLRGAQSHLGQDRVLADPSWRELVAGYFRQTHAPAWSVLLMGGFAFIGAAWFYLKPMLLDLGWSVQQAAAVAGVQGGLLAALAALATSGLTRRFGAIRTLPWCMGLNTVALLALAAAAGAAGSNTLALRAAVWSAAIAMGASSSCLFGLMMRFARSGTQAADYGLQASLFSLSRLLVPVAAGATLDAGGAPLMLCVLAAGAALMAGWAWRSRRWLA